VKCFSAWWIPSWLLLLYPSSNADHEECRSEENAIPAYCPGSVRGTGIADAQEIQEEAGRDVEEQEGGQEEPGGRISGQRKEAGTIRHDM